MNIYEQKVRPAFVWLKPFFFFLFRRIQFGPQEDDVAVGDIVELRLWSGRRRRPQYVLLHPSIRRSEVVASPLGRFAPRRLGGHHHQPGILPAFYHIRGGIDGREQGHVQAVRQVRGTVSSEFKRSINLLSFQ